MKRPQPVNAAPVTPLSRPRRSSSETSRTRRIGLAQEGGSWSQKFPVGQYEFFRWGNGKSMAVSYRSIRPFSIPFAVSEGKATYIGRLFINVNESNRTFKMPLSDQFERDTELLLRRYKNIRADEIAREVTTVK